ncbi:MAG TPA: ring-cleaving dioxygenase [Thermoanaerobaculia bacterium]|jgi:glyoxalase family protein|nr:ring-cleaving dioxygenase [Thermoanaerobaculia bacterium]
MNHQIAGIHHVTAIARDPQTNADFYTGVLGLRLVKKTVNFDDPGTYHLYYGDEVGRPGTILTFFPWPLARLGSRGAGQATVTAFSVPEGSLGYWTERLLSLGVDFEAPRSRFDEEVLALRDPDGLLLELVARAGDECAPWTGGPVPEAAAVRGFYNVTLTEWNPAVTSELLTETLGFRLLGEEGDRLRFIAGGDGAGGAGSRLDILAAPGAARGVISAGTVHHVAFRAADDAEQLAWQETLAARGLHVTPVQERQYFRSIYFREPGGVLFEIATDAPGFAIDEPVASLGSDLKLPPWLEASRQRIAEALPPLTLRPAASVAVPVGAGPVGGAA